MDIQELAEAIYNRTSGYPYLVSGLCKYLDEEICGTADFPDRKQAWTKDGVIEAEKLLTTENNPLFQSLTGKESVLYNLFISEEFSESIPRRTSHHRAKGVER